MNENLATNPNIEYINQANSSATTTPATEPTAFPFLEMGTSFVIGLAIGYFIKKSFKFLLLFLGLGLVALFVMESQGMFKVDDHMIENGVSSGIDSFNHLVAMLKDRLSKMNLSSGAGAVAGFFAGIKFG